MKLLHLMLTAFYNRSTNSNGIAKLNINLPSGNYTITAFNPKDGLFKSNKIKVLSSINSSDLKKIYKDSNQYWQHSDMRTVKF